MSELLHKPTHLNGNQVLQPSHCAFVVANVVEVLTHGHNICSCSAEESACSLEFLPASSQDITQWHKSPTSSWSSKFMKFKVHMPLPTWDSKNVDTMNRFDLLTWDPFSWDQLPRGQLLQDYLFMKSTAMRSASNKISPYKINLQNYLYQCSCICMEISMHCCSTYRALIKNAWAPLHVRMCSPSADLMSEHMTTLCVLCSASNIILETERIERLGTKLHLQLMLKKLWQYHEKMREEFILLMWSYIHHCGM